MAPYLLLLPMPRGLGESWCFSLKPCAARNLPQTYPNQGRWFPLWSRGTLAGGYQGEQCPHVQEYQSFLVWWEQLWSRNLGMMTSSSA